jgi:hypothetical protein
MKGKLIEFLPKYKKPQEYNDLGGGRGRIVSGRILHATSEPEWTQW